MLRRLVMTAVMLFALSLPSFAQDMVPDVVSVSGRFSMDSLRRGDDFKLAVILDIQKGFHTNANIPTADFPTEIRLDPLPGLEFGKPEYPAPTMKSFVFSPEELPVYEGKITIIVPGKVRKNASLGRREITGLLSYQSCDDTSCYPPVKMQFYIPLKVVDAGAKVKSVNQVLFNTSPTVEKGVVKPESRPVDKATGELVDKINEGGLPFIFVAGLLLCLSPCVFPMVPVIVGYFGGQGQGRRTRVSVLALLFVIGLAVTYSILGTAAALAGKGLGTIMQHPSVPIVVAGVLVLLALSMFGLYEIPVPSFIANRSQARSGALGALAMGLIFGMVAAPCVGPAVVALLMVVGQVGDPFKGFLMFFTLSLGLGTPFFFLALFSGSLAKIPKPGTWMMAVRKVFGFLLLGAAIYYVKQLLPETLAHMLIPLYLIAAGIYWAVFELSTRGTRVLRPVQQLLGVAVVALGAWTLFAPLAQPMQWTTYTQKAAIDAQSAGKPVIIDFTAKWCKPCEELDKTTFSNEGVKKEAERFVRLSVDLTKNSDVSEKAVNRYKVAGPPTIILLDSKGEEKDRVVGYINAGDFLTRMKMVE